MMNHVDLYYVYVYFNRHTEKKKILNTVVGNYINIIRRLFINNDLIPHKNLFKLQVYK